MGDTSIVVAVGFTITGVVAATGTSTATAATVGLTAGGVAAVGTTTTSTTTAVTIGLTAAGTIFGVAATTLTVLCKANGFVDAGLTWPPGVVTPYGDNMIRKTIEPMMTYISGDLTRRFYIRGGLAPISGVQDGITMQALRGMHAPFKHLDQQGAHQDGVTWNDTVYDPAEIDMTLTAWASTAAKLSQLVRTWIASWDPKKPGILEYFTFEMGCWWCNARLFRSWPDEIKKSPRQHKKQIFTHAMRNDDAFWRSVDSVSTFQPGGTGGTGFTPLTNIGDQDGWPRYLVYGPGTFAFSDGPGSTNMITFGPLLATQIVLITTLPRLRSIVDLSPTQLPQTLSQAQSFIQMLINLVTNNNTPPLLQWFESLFGIRPPQGALYSLLNGRFSKPIPGVVQPSEAVTSNIAVSITGGNSASKIVSALTPLRRWPE